VSARPPRDPAGQHTPQPDPRLHWWDHHVSTPRVRRALALLAACLIGVLAVSWAGVALLGALPGDAESAAEVREEPLSWLVLAPARALDWLGHPIPGAVIVVALAGWLWRRIGWRHAVLVVGAAAVVGVTSLIKEAVGRSRPEGALLSDPSFPSGHTAWAAAVFGVAAVLAIERRRWRAAAGCLAIVGVMGPSRVLLGVHWASDVVAGYAVGLAWLIGLLLVGLPWAGRDRNRVHHDQATRT